MKKEFLLYILLLMAFSVNAQKLKAKKFMKVANKKIRKGEYMKTGEQDKIICYYDSAILLNPKLLNAYFGRGWMNEYLGNFTQAIADYDEVIKLDKKNEPAYFQRATTNGKMGNANEAVADYTKLIELNPNAYHAYFGRAWEKALNLSDKKGACEDFKKVEQLTKGSTWAFYAPFRHWFCE